VLESDETIQACVSRPVDLTHTTETDEREDLVWAETSPGPESCGTNVAGQRLQGADEDRGIEPPWKPAGPLLRLEVGSDVFYADAFGTTRILQHVRAPLQIEVPDGVEHGAHAPPCVRIECGPIPSSR
jgi:hypothetical protein